MMTYLIRYSHIIEHIQCQSIAETADERLGDPQGDPGAFSGQTGMEDPKRTLFQCTASVCVAGVHCWEISLG